MRRTVSRRVGEWGWVLRYASSYFFSMPFFSFHPSHFARSISTATKSLVLRSGKRAAIMPCGWRWSILFIFLGTTRFSVSLCWFSGSRQLLSSWVGRCDCHDHAHRPRDGTGVARPGLVTESWKSGQVLSATRTLSWKGPLTERWIHMGRTTPGHQAELGSPLGMNRSRKTKSLQLGKQQ